MAAGLDVSSFGQPQGQNLWCGMCVREKPSCVCDGDSCRVSVTFLFVWCGEIILVPNTALEGVKQFPGLGLRWLEPIFQRACELIFSLLGDVVVSNDTEAAKCHVEQRFLQHLGEKVGDVEWAGTEKGPDFIGLMMVTDPKLA